MSFLNEMQNVLNDEKTYTENGAVAYKTSGKQLLDFNFNVSALRNVGENEIKEQYRKVFYEDPLLAVKYLFYLGDVRGGLGERRSFKICLTWLAENHPNVAKELLTLIPIYTRWDNLWCLLDTKIKNDVLKVVSDQLYQDILNMKDGKPVSLLAKWLKSENASSKETKRIAKILHQGLGLDSKTYRKTLSELRRYLNVTEVKMSANEWDSIKYETVPSKANLLYKDAFLRHDPDRRNEYLESLKNGNTKINAGTLQPHEITYKYRGLRKVDPTLEELWKVLPNLSVENTLVVRDGSASMTWVNLGNSGATPLDAATALAIYMSEHNTGELRNKFVTFSSKPKIVDLSHCKDLYSKVKHSLSEAGCSNTNIYSTMKLILNTAVKANMTQEDMPKTIVICSDMQFDGRCHNLNKSLFDSIKEEYEEHGYMLPKICFWNLAGSVNNTVPMQQNDLGLILCSSFSVQILNMFMSGRTDPYECLVEQLNSERYKPVEVMIKDII